jgi:hypothetical protein
MLVFALLVLGFLAVSLLFGLIIGRWWACLGAIAVGVALTLREDDGEIPGWFIGVAYAVLTGLGIAAGVSLRKHSARNYDS